MIVWLGALTITDGHACSCGPPRGDFLAPAPGAVDQPRNTRVRIGSVMSIAGGPFDVVEDGVSRTDVRQEARVFGPNTVVDVWVEAPYTPGAVVEVRDLGTDFVWTTFQVGDDVDDASPTWGGGYDTSSVSEESYSCDRLWAHTFRWLDLGDDHTPTADLLAVLEPADDAFELARGWGDALFVGYGLCSRDDPTLMLDFHRRYEVTFEDLAGNRSEPVPVNTRGCGSGCAALPAPGLPPSPWLALGLVGALRRTSRRR